MYWCQSIVAEPAQKPRSDVMGPQLVMHSLTEIYHWLGWTGGPWPRPPHWRTTLKEAGYKYAIVSDSAGKVRVEVSGCR